MKKVVFPRGGMPPIGPYSPAVIAGNMMFVSGQLGVDPKTGTIPGTTIDDETKQVMLNIEGILKEVGLTFDHVVKTTIFLKNMDDFGHVNKVYGSYFKEGSYPARETVEVSRLPKNANVEISVIVYIPTK